MISTKNGAATPPPVSVAEPARFTPDNLKDRDPPPVFLLKIPTVRENVQLSMDMELEGLRYPQDAELYGALRGGIIESVVDDEQPALLQIIDEAEAAADEGNTLSKDLADHLEKISQVLRPFYRPLQQLFAERARWIGLAPLLRAEKLLIGVEGEPPLARWGGKLTEAAVEAIEGQFGSGTIRTIGLHTFGLTTPTEDERKNSELPAPSPPDPEISTAEPRHRTARSGKSSVNGIDAIPA